MEKSLKRAITDDDSRWEVYSAIAMLVIGLFAFALAVAAILRAEEVDHYRCQIATAADCLTEPAMGRGWTELKADLGAGYFTYELHYSLAPGAGSLQRVLLRGPRVAADGTILAPAGTEAPIALTLCGGTKSCASLEEHTCASKKAADGTPLPDGCGFIVADIKKLDSATPDVPVSTNPHHAMTDLMDLLRKAPHNFYYVAESTADPTGAHCSSMLGEICRL